uniref:Uncharacterized protein n=2 Tax=Micrurus lemniscatus lemniscatus TaxID=129467 RepID=A0A2D4J778_MICLE
MVADNLVVSILDIILFSFCVEHKILFLSFFNMAIFEDITKHNILTGLYLKMCFKIYCDFFLLLVSTNIYKGKRNLKFRSLGGAGYFIQKCKDQEVEYRERKLNFEIEKGAKDTYISLLLEQSSILKSRTKFMRN